MKKQNCVPTYICMILSVFLAGCPGGNESPNTGDPHRDFSSYKLVKQDEFNGQSIDTSIWNFDNDANGNNVGWGNSEAQHYTDSTDDNAYIEDGKLVIVAKKENMGNKEYTSARLHTHGNFAVKYGIIEARIRMPSSKNGQTDSATFPAFWMLGDNFNGWGHGQYGGNTPWPASGEIDITESNQNPNGYSKALGTVHWQNNGGNHQYQGGKTDISNANSSYHIYGIKWTKTDITFYLDSNDFYTMTIQTDQSEFQEKFFLLLNLAIGGPGTAFTGGNTADASKYPQYMYIDWVRIYQDPNEP